MVKVWKNGKEIEYKVDEGENEEKVNQISVLLRKDLDDVFKNVKLPNRNDPDGAPRPIVVIDAHPNGRRATKEKLERKVN